MSATRQGFGRGLREHTLRWMHMDALRRLGTKKPAFPLV